MGYDELAGYTPFIKPELEKEPEEADLLSANDAAQTPTEAEAVPGENAESAPPGAEERAAETEEAAQKPEVSAPEAQNPAEDAAQTQQAPVQRMDSTYEIVSKVAYLIGVPKRIFENEHEPPKLVVYERMDRDKTARIIRHLCIIRTAIEKNFKRINELMRTEFRSVLSMPELVPSDSIQQLSYDGISFYKKTSTKLCHHVIEINRLISDRINNCKSLFPIWINWSYLREIFIMPKGLTEEGTKAAADTYYQYRAYYPYQMYLNWRPSDEGNILFSDKKFTFLLYKWHKDTFTEHSKVQDAGAYVKNSIYDFVNSSTRTVIVVDCENSDPYSLCATLKGLDYEVMQKISKIILFDDVHTATAWGILESYTRIPVEHNMIERVKQNKSLVDITLSARTCREFYANGVDSFLLASSDSDYWGLIQQLPDAKFLVMVEHSKCGPDIKTALDEAGIFYCYLDDFYSGTSEDIKLTALFTQMRSYIESAVHLNVNDMFNTALMNTRIDMAPAEKQQFYDKYIKQMSLSIAENGDVSIDLRMK